jgi:sugar phosphate permease
LATAAVPQDLGGPRAAASAAGLINGIGSLGAVLQGALTALVVQQWGWEALFFAFIGLALLSGLVLLPIAYGKEKRVGE